MSRVISPIGKSATVFKPSIGVRVWKVCRNTVPCLSALGPTIVACKPPLISVMAVAVASAYVPSVFKHEGSLSVKDSEGYVARTTTRPRKPARASMMVKQLRSELGS